MTKELPVSKNLSHLLSDEANSRNPSNLKQAFKYFNDPNVISLGGGLPLAEFFPFDNIRVDTLQPPFGNGINAAPTGDDKLEVAIHKDIKKAGDDIPLAVSLQYGTTEGNQKLLNFIREHTKKVHDVAFKDWDVLLSVGNTEAWDTVLRTFTNRGDAILAEEFAFPSAAEAAHGNGITIVPAKMDLDGIIPEQLDDQLNNWVGNKPKLLYTVPTGQNPTGSTLSAERRQAVYKIAQKHDLIIVEDEPYYFLQMPTYTKDEAKRAELEKTPSYDEFLNGLVPSYLNFDVEGRVIRLDSFSKVLAPGSRVGWIVAQERFIERMLRLHEVSIQVASGFGQSIVYGVLQRWGQQGYLDWLVGLRKTYTHKRDIAVDAMEKYLPKEVVEFIAPTAGMFFWIKVDARKHPQYKGQDVVKFEEDMYMRGIERGVQLVPGHWFVMNDKTNPPQKERPQSDEDAHALYYRGTFASVPHDRLTEAIRLFGAHLREEFGV